MSLGVVISCPEGIVLASDTRMTLTYRPHLNQDPIDVNYDDSRKLITLDEPHNYVATVVQGHTTVLGRHIHSWVQEFQQTLPDTRLSVSEYTDLLFGFFIQLWRQQSGSKTALDFIVGGVNDGDPYGEVHRFSIDGVEPYRSVDRFGMSWGGQTQIVTRLINGYDPSIPNALAGAFPDIKAKEFNGVLASAAPMVFPWEYLPIQSCIDLAILLIRTTMEAQRLSVTPRGVGGMIEVAIVTPQLGFKWIQRYELQGE